MSLKWKEIESVLKVVEPTVAGSIIQKIVQSSSFAFGEAIIISGNHVRHGTWNLVFSLMSKNEAIFLMPSKFKIKAMKKPSNFIMVLRKHLIGKLIADIIQIKNERIILFSFTNKLTLLIELIPNRSNILLLKEWEKNSGVCLDFFRRVTLGVGAKYKIPPPPEQVYNTKREFNKNINSYNDRVADYILKSIEESEFLENKKLIKNSVKIKKRKIDTAYAKMQKNYKKSENFDVIKEQAVLLNSALYKLGAKSMPGASEIKLFNLEDIAVKIPLDVKLNYSENVNKLFKQVKKFKRAIIEIDRQIQKIKGKKEIIDELIVKIEMSDDWKSLNHCKIILEKEKIQIIKINENKKTGRNETAKPFLEFTSAEGFAIICGRNKLENRRVTFREAKGNDMWMHVKDVPGAHVIIKSKRNKTFPLATLLVAAQITLFYSKIDKDKKQEVVYTLRKHMRSVKGTIAEVTYTRNKSLYLKIDNNLLRDLMGSRSS